LFRPPLSCTVRGCQEALHKGERSFICARGHAYDIARSGYVNLLQPQDRKSTDAGDSREAIGARAALVQKGVGRATIDNVVARAASLLSHCVDPVVSDLGSGSGETLGLLSAVQSPLCGVGIDLSIHAAALAARRFPTLTWVVANADRRLPLLDHSIDALISVHARRNPPECRRVLAPTGFLLMAIPAADDLIELREAVQGAAVERDRVASLIAEHDAEFTLADQWRTSQRVELEPAALLDLLLGTYRGLRFSESSRVRSLEHLNVTLASDVLLFRPR
jgi:23S rRNA (guanine745-N1)-methyltransferase